MAYHLVPLNDSQARDILKWRYPEPYAFYDPPGDHIDDDEYVREFLNPEYQFHAVMRDVQNHEEVPGQCTKVVNALNEETGSDQRLFMGFCSFGIDGQVAGGTYDDSALDIGLGMKPAFTGQGHGSAFFSAITDYAGLTYQPAAFRLTVAAFNLRAIKLYQSHGFTEVHRFIDTQFRITYIMMYRETGQ